MDKLLLGLLLGVVIAVIFNIDTQSIANFFYRLGNLVEQTPAPELNQEF